MRCVVVAVVVDADAVVVVEGSNFVFVAVSLHSFVEE